MNFSFKSLIFAVTLTSTALIAGASGRVIYLNGIDISSAKNQNLNQVSVRIDAQGQIYIEAPQYGVELDTSFIPLGKQMPPHPNLPEHKAPGPLTKQVETIPGKPDLAPSSETSDTQDQADFPHSPGKTSEPTAKEGSRRPPDGNPNSEEFGAALSPGQK